MELATQMAHQLVELRRAALTAIAPGGVAAALLLILFPSAHVSPGTVTASADRSSPCSNEHSLACPGERAAELRGAADRTRLPAVAGTV